MNDILMSYSTTHKAYLWLSFVKLEKKHGKFHALNFYTIKKENKT